ncbi:high affinity cAMP-specific 3',5'-cyclic phosphodiesterase 7A [Platysternon megacephalum]|uniref:High affinity cAMP-specific 3',5'-cyclic phosphodiesterase 7A n=1 Tax=Platysternon megacephalum TaxID=55544 RepID=A0A4D9EK43_9SAUR|nr:high affinity cAMP-specific 3',5'-cyclic phosphodiesterase 7A [Platysternon megacephalum]
MELSKDPNPPLPEKKKQVFHWLQRDQDLSLNFHWFALIFALDLCKTFQKTNMQNEMIWGVGVGAGITICKVVLSQSDLKHSATWDEATYWLTKILISNSARHYHRERNVANNIFSQIL